MQALYEFLLESDLPVALQVFWKLLGLAGTGLLVYAALSATSAQGTVAIGLLAGLWFLMTLFTKLGEG